MKRLGKQRKIQFSNDCEKALVILESYGVNVRDFVRQAVEEKMHKDFRKTIQKIKQKRNKDLIPF
jgi:cobalamin biosynthesis protein CbiD